MNSEHIKSYFDGIAHERDAWKLKNEYYHDDVKSFMRYHVRPGTSVLDIGCGPGDLLDSLHPSEGVGIDISPKMVEIALK